VREACYRTALNEEYEEKSPSGLGGTSQDFLGNNAGESSYSWLGSKSYKGNFLGTGLHGGDLSSRRVDRHRLAAGGDLTLDGAAGRS
jgi:hypothetical protein